MMLTVIDDAQRAYGLGVEAYLTKPFDEEEVLAEIQRLLGKRNQKRRGGVGPKQESQTLLEHLTKPK